MAYIYPMLHALTPAFILLLLTTCGLAPNENSAGGASAKKVTTVYLVRHAEKEAGEDPALTPAGQRRAENLAKVLRGVKLDAVYSTDTQRTRMTAGPTATDQSLEIKSYDPSDLRGFAGQLKDAHRNQTILVVGHSNSTPALVNQLTGTTDYTAIDEADFGDLFIVAVPRNGAPSVREQQY